jgi:hypothetical protein
MKTESFDIKLSGRKQSDGNAAAARRFEAFGASAGPPKGANEIEGKGATFLEGSRMVPSSVHLPPFAADYRASGVLLHVSLLPSPFGIGDWGPAAQSWIDCQHRRRRLRGSAGTVRLRGHR